MTKIAWLDSAIAILFGSVIIYTGYKILRETTSNLMDQADFKLLERVSNILWENKSQNWIEIHNLKLVKYGTSHHIDCDLTLPWYMNIADAHKESDSVVKIISKYYPDNLDFTIHIDACSSDLCKHCKIAYCKYRKQEFTNEIKWTLERITKQNGKMSI